MEAVFLAPKERRNQFLQPRAHAIVSGIRALGSCVRGHRNLRATAPTESELEFFVKPIGELWLPSQRDAETGMVSRPVLNRRSRIERGVDAGGLRASTVVNNFISVNEASARPRLVVEKPPQPPPTNVRQASVRGSQLLKEVSAGEGPTGLAESSTAPAGRHAPKQRRLVQSRLHCGLGGPPRSLGFAELHSGVAQRLKKHCGSCLLLSLSIGKMLSSFTFMDNQAAKCDSACHKGV